MVVVTVSDLQFLIISYNNIVKAVVVVLVTEAEEEVMVSRFFEFQTIKLTSL